MKGIPQLSKLNPPNTISLNSDRMQFTRILIAWVLFALIYLTDYLLLAKNMSDWESPSDLINTNLHANLCKMELYNNLSHCADMHSQYLPLQ